jgi:hypothetical protein
MAEQTEIPTLYFQYWEKEDKFVLMDKDGHVEDDAFSGVDEIVHFIADKWDSGDEFLVHFMSDKKD